MSCSHLQYCDTTDNINQEVYEQMAQAAASVLNVSFSSVTVLVIEFLQTLMMKDNLKGFLNPSEYMYDYVLEDVDGDI